LILNVAFEQGAIFSFCTLAAFHGAFSVRAPSFQQISRIALPRLNVSRTFPVEYVPSFQISLSLPHTHSKRLLLLLFCSCEDGMVPPYLVFLLFLWFPLTAVCFPVLPQNIILTIPTRVPICRRFRKDFSLLTPFPARRPSGITHPFPWCPFPQLFH